MPLCVTSLVSLPLQGFDANFAFARTEDGQVFAWGGAGHAIFDEAATKPDRAKAQQQEQEDQHKRNSETENSACGEGRGSCFLFPRLISSITNKRVVHLACGRTNGHIAMTSDKGECFTWGRGEYGELGASEYGSKPTTEEPIRVETLCKFHVATVSVGNTHTAAITDKGKVYAWGSCWSGQLGLGEANVRESKTNVCSYAFRFLLLSKHFNTNGSRESPAELCIPLWCPQTDSSSPSVVAMEGDWDSVATRIRSTRS